MWTTIAKKIFSSITTIILITMLSILLFLNIPGDYVSQLGESVEKQQEIRHELMLDKPKSDQFIIWTKKAINLDFGKSFGANKPASDIIKNVLKDSWLMYLSTFLVSMLLGTFLGCICGYKKGSSLDNFFRFFVLISVSAPVVIICSIIIFIFVTFFGVSLENIDLVMNKLIWPLFVFINIPIFVKYSRNTIIDVLSQDYIKTARGKGLSEFKVIFKHAFSNSCLGLIGIMSIAVNNSIFAGCLIEVVVHYYGIGSLTTAATLSRDYPIMLSCIMLLSTTTVVLNLLFDILTYMVDPSVRIRQEV